MQHRRQWLLQIPKPCNNARWQALPTELYTDGSTLDSQLPDATLAGAAYHACFKDSPERTYGCLVPGLQQGSDRAEVFAVAQAVAKLAKVASELQHASAEVALMSDCQWVVRRFQDLCLPQAVVQNDETHYDLWQDIQKALRQLSNQCVVVRAQWLPSHTTVQQVAQGLVSAHACRCNEQADRAAKQAVQKAVRQANGHQFVQNLRCDMRACAVRQLHNMAVINKRWQAVKATVPEEADEEEGTCAHYVSDSQAQPPVLTDATQSLNLAERAAGLDVERHRPTQDEVKQCRYEVPFYL